jgi:hypothetical protein
MRLDLHTDGAQKTTQMQRQLGAPEKYIAVTKRVGQYLDQSRPFCCRTPPEARDDLPPFVEFHIRHGQPGTPRLDAPPPERVP